MFKRLLIVFGFMLVFSEATFACCALCNSSIWDILLIPFYLIGIFFMMYYKFFIAVFLLYVTIGLVSYYTKDDKCLK